MIKLHGEFTQNEQYNLSLFSHFNTFSELLLDCNQTYEITEYVKFLPNKPILIDDSFALEKLLSPTKISSIQLLQLASIVGIDLQYKSVFRQPDKLKPMNLNIFFSKLDIYSNGQLINKTQCNLVTFNNLNNFFTPFLGVLFKKVAYPKSFCPLIFINTHVIKIRFGDISSTFIDHNRLKFADIQLDRSIKINISFVEFDLCYESLTQSLMPKNLFKNLFELTIYGIINYIESDLFKEFTFL